MPKQGGYSPEATVAEQSFPSLGSHFLFCAWGAGVIAGALAGFRCFAEVMKKLREVPLPLSHPLHLNALPL